VNGGEERAEKERGHTAYEPPMITTGEETLNVLNPPPQQPGPALGVHLLVPLDGGLPSHTVALRRGICPRTEIRAPDVHY